MSTGSSNDTSAGVPAPSTDVASIGCSDGDRTPPANDYTKILIRTNSKLSYRRKISSRVGGGVSLPESAYSKGQHVVLAIARTKRFIRVLLQNISTFSSLKRKGFYICTIQDQKTNVHNCDFYFESTASHKQLEIIFCNLNVKKHT